MRFFDKAIVLVNPSVSQSAAYTLEKPYRMVIPQGGGALPENGLSDGVLLHETVSGTLTLSLAFPLNGRHTICNMN